MTSILKRFLFLSLLLHVLILCVARIEPQPPPPRPPRPLDVTLIPGHAAGTRARAPMAMQARPAQSWQRSDKRVMQPATRGDARGVPVPSVASVRPAAPRSAAHGGPDRAPSTAAGFGQGSTAAPTVVAVARAGYGGDLPREPPAPEPPTARTDALRQVWGDLADAAPEPVRAEPRPTSGEPLGMVASSGTTALFDAPLPPPDDAPAHSPPTTMTADRSAIALPGPVSGRWGDGRAHWVSPAAPVPDQARIYETAARIAEATRHARTAQLDGLTAELRALAQHWSGLQGSMAGTCRPTSDPAPVDLLECDPRALREAIASDGGRVASVLHALSRLNGNAMALAAVGRDGHFDVSLRSAENAGLHAQPLTEPQEPGNVR